MPKQSIKTVLAGFKEQTLSIIDKYILMNYIDFVNVRKYSVTLSFQAIVLVYNECHCDYQNHSNTD